MKRIRFHEQTPTRWFKERNYMREVLLRLFKREGKTLEGLDVIFCSDEYLLSMNQQFLNHDTYTDIITFDLSNRKDFAASGKKLPIIGELYISIDRITENALSFGVTKDQELRRVIFHGCLHLCGFGDKTKAQVVEMRKKEEENLRFFDKNRR